MERSWLFLVGREEEEEQGEEVCYVNSQSRGNDSTACCRLAVSMRLLRIFG